MKADRSAYVLSESDQVDLIHRIAAGDKTAMRELYECHSDAAFQFARSWLANPFDAADVLNDAMIDVWKGAGRFGGRSTVRSWIFSIVRNKAVDRNRKGARLTYTEALPDSVDEAPEPEAYLSASQDAEKVRDCVSKLGETHRRVIHLAFFEDMSYREIAEIENCPLGTVKSRVMHAKALLQRCLSQKS